LLGKGSEPPLSVGGRAPHAALAVELARVERRGAPRAFLAARERSPRVGWRSGLECLDAARRYRRYAGVGRSPARAALRGRGRRGGDGRLLRTEDRVSIAPSPLRSSPRRKWFALAAVVLVLTAAISALIGLEPRRETPAPSVRSPSTPPGASAAPAPSTPR